MLQVVPCLAMFDTMKHIGSDVATVGFGACMGMSGFLLAVGKKARKPASSLRLAVQSVRTQNNSPKMPWACEQQRAQCSLQELRPAVIAILPLEL